jgi:long-subunit fatty acid transport protein
VNYYNDLNEVIKERYRGALNLRVGGELKFKTIMTRLGFAYLGSPYAVDELKTNRMLLSGGLGYRNKGIFIDLTYVHALIKDTDVPYYLTDKPSPIADGKNNRGNVVLTFGIKI